MQLKKIDYTPFEKLVYRRQYGSWDIHKSTFGRISYGMVFRDAGSRFVVQVGRESKIFPFTMEGYEQAKGHYEFSIMSALQTIMREYLEGVE